MNRLAIDEDDYLKIRMDDDEATGAPGRGPDFKPRFTAFHIRQIYGVRYLRKQPVRQ